MGISRGNRSADAILRLFHARSAVAPRRDPPIIFFHGLKPMATVMSSLREAGAKKRGLVLLGSIFRRRLIHAIRFLVISPLSGLGEFNLFILFPTAALRLALG